MSTRLEGGAAAGSVTGIAVANAAGIMRPAAAGESRSRMTGRTIEAGRNMGRYCIYHAGCRITIMAGGAIVSDAGVIKGRRNESAGSMANPAILVSCNMA